MNWFQRLVARVRPTQPENDRGTLIGRTQSGQYVDEDVALRYATVWRCIDVTAKAIGILPQSVYEKTKTGRKERLDGVIRWILHNQPNPEMNPYQFKHALVTHLLSWGNAYCEIERDSADRPLWLWPLTPDRVKPFRDASSQQIIYRVRNQGAADSELEARNVLHLRGLGFDGLIGYSPIRKAAESIGLGLAMEEFGASFFGNGSHMGGYLTHPQRLSDPARKNLEDSLQKRSGRKNAGKWLVLEEGLTPQQMSIPPDEAQFLESRKHHPIEICRWFGVPPHKVFQLERATWNNIEHQNLEFASDAVQPIVTQFEQEADLKLFGRVNRGVLYTKFNMAALLRGDQKSRFEAYEIGHRNGWLNADEIRALEDMNPIPGGLGKLYVMQAQMTTRQHIKEGKQPKVAPSPGDPIDDPVTSDDPLKDDTVDNVMRSKRVLNVARSRK